LKLRVQGQFDPQGVSNSGQGNRHDAAHQQ